MTDITANIDDGRRSATANELRPAEPPQPVERARRDPPGYDRAREVERRAQFSRFDDPTLERAKKRLAEFLSEEREVRDGLPGQIFDARV